MVSCGGGKGWARCNGTGWEGRTSGHKGRVGCLLTARRVMAGLGRAWAGQQGRAGLGWAGKQSLGGRRGFMASCARNITGGVIQQILSRPFPMKSGRGRAISSPAASSASFW